MPVRRNPLRRYYGWATSSERRFATQWLLVAPLLTAVPAFIIVTAFDLGRGAAMVPLLPIAVWGGYLLWRAGGALFGQGGKPR